MGECSVLLILKYLLICIQGEEWKRESRDLLSTAIPSASGGPGSCMGERT